MKRARIAKLKNNLSRYLEHVRRGGSVLVLDRDRPVARIVPLERPAEDTDAAGQRLARLERRGLIRRGVGGRRKPLRTLKPVRVRGSVLRDLLDERRGGW